MMDEDLIIEIWDIFKEYIADKNKDIAANHFVDFLVGKDITPKELGAITGFDAHLDEAIKLVLADEEDIDEDDVDYDYGEDEE
jgi:hypothetical protein